MVIRRNPSWDSSESVGNLTPSSSGSRSYSRNSSGGDVYNPSSYAHMTQGMYVTGDSIVLDGIQYSFDENDNLRSAPL